MNQYRIAIRINTLDELDNETIRMDSNIISVNINVIPFAFLFTYMCPPPHINKLMRTTTRGFFCRDGGCLNICLGAGCAVGVGATCWGGVDIGVGCIAGDIEVCLMAPVGATLAVTPLCSVFLGANL